MYYLVVAAAVEFLDWNLLGFITGCFKVYSIQVLLELEYREREMGKVERLGN